MRKINFAFLFFAFVLLNAQSDRNVESSQLQLGLPLPSILYEIGIGANSTTSLEVNTGLVLRGCTDCQTNFGIYGILRGQYRYYYNMKRRLRKGKNILNNSGNYLAALVMYQNGNALIGNLNTTTTLGVGPVYGLQRKYKKGFFYRLEGGIAYISDDFDQGLGLVLAVRVGWVIHTR